MRVRRGGNEMERGNGATRQTDADESQSCPDLEDPLFGAT